MKASETPYEGTLKPRLRPVEAFPHDDQDGEQQMVVVRDPSHLSDVVLTMSVPALQVLTLLDGSNSLDDIRAHFHSEMNQNLPHQTLANLIRCLEDAHFLAGDSFERYYDTLRQAYRDAPVRVMNSLSGMGLNENAVDRQLDGMFDWSQKVSSDRVVGIIAPHLDYPRGLPCYQEAYAALQGSRHLRYVVLGTNHFGLSPAVVATRKPFATPLGTTPVDLSFLSRLEERCGSSLCDFELDHQREHSVELQVMLLQHLFGADSFSLVPVLCPDPCGSSGTAPWNDEGVDLQVFAAALGELLREEETPTCIIAGADLSHFGSFFGDEVELSESRCAAVEESDRRHLEAVSAANPEGFRRGIAAEANPTHICSAGCIYALLTALPDARVEVRKYHQAVDTEAQCAVTCAAAVLTVAS